MMDTGSFSTVTLKCHTIIAIITVTSAPAADAAHSDRMYSQKQEVHTEMGGVLAM